LSELWRLVTTYTVAEGLDKKQESAKIAVCRKGSGRGFDLDKAAAAGGVL
jgi:hypothetical protein